MNKQEIQNKYWLDFATWCRSQPKEYDAVIDQGFEACLKVYQANRENRNDWSTDFEDKDDE